MSKNSTPPFQRSYGSILTARLQEPRRFLQVVAGPRQVGKTTLVGQVLEGLQKPSLFVSADEPTLRDPAWIAEQWERARLLAGDSRGKGAVLAMDEIQKIPGWSEIVKGLWDQDTRNRVPLHVVVLGSAPLLVRRGLSESLAGRFEILYLPHWSFEEMREAFGFTLDEYVFFGGYPGAAPLAGDFPRWRRYILDSLVETTISRDILLLTRVNKPVLLRRLFELGCRYSGRILSYNKIMGQIQDAGNTTTLAHYLELLSGAGMLTGLSKFTAGEVRSRASSPKFQVLNTALLTAQAGLSPEETRKDRDFLGRLVESAVGAHLANGAAQGLLKLFYWREKDREVDFVIQEGRDVTAIEVKSGRQERPLPGMALFRERFHPNRSLLVGEGGIPLEDFLSRPPTHWL